MMSEWPSVSYFADGKHVPDLLTESEAVKYLRLNALGLKHPDATLRRYRDAGVLKAVQVGKQILFPLPELRAFVLRQMEAVPR